MSSGYGNRIDPLSGKRAFHSGVDFAGPAGFSGVGGGVGNSDQLSLSGGEEWATSWNLTMGAAM